jgi:hypothetical protein
VTNNSRSEVLSSSSAARLALSDTVTPTSHENEMPRDTHRDADDTAEYSLVKPDGIP